MVSVDSYRSLIAWQRASGLCEAILEAVDDAWGPRAAGIFERLRRAAVSVDVNIVEGYALQTAPLFRHHLRIAIGSAAETERLLQIAAKRGYLSPQAVERLMVQVGGTFQALVGLVRSPRLHHRKP
jgi:four helix bundle protein